MTLRVAINGYGRIGRCVLRAAYEADRRNGLRVVAINDVADPATLAHLTRYDSTHGRFPGAVELADGKLRVEGDVIELRNEPDVAALRWPEVDLVMECSGAFRDVATARLHLGSAAEPGAGRVLFSQPALSDVDFTIVYGVNHEQIPADAKVLSNASCTTNCIVPVLKVLDDAFGVEAGAITTIHSAMNDQPVIDSFHDSDLRKTRSAMQSIIPVRTALARGIVRILPGLDGKLEARAIRVPTVNVSAMDVSLRFARAAGVEQVNDAIIRGSRKLPADVLGYTREPLASCDINHDPRSAVVDLEQTREIAGLVKLFVWFDNEWAYANRMLDVAEYLHARAGSGRRGRKKAKLL